MATPYRYLAEGAIRYMQTYIETNIPSALNNVAAVVATNFSGVPNVSLENPQAYYIFERPNGAQCPFVILIMDDMDFKIQERQANFLNAQDKINVSIVVEDEDQDTLTIKAYRYQSALHYVLDGAQIQSGDSSMVLKVVVYRARFSNTYSVKEKNFRKEVLLECGVTHLEQY